MSHKNINIFYLFSTLVTTCLYFVFCSCGTEVGNGYSTGGDSKKSNSSNSGNTTEQVTVEANNPSSTNDNSIMPDASNKEEQSNSVVLGTNSDYDQFEFKAIIAECASPFAQKNLQSPISLEIKMKANENVTKTEESIGIGEIATWKGSYWLIKEADSTKNSEITLKITPTGQDHRIEIKSTEDEPIVDQFQCSSEVTETQHVQEEGKTGLYTKYVVKLTLAEKSFDLVWYINEGSLNSSGELKLEQIILTETSGSATNEYLFNNKN